MKLVRCAGILAVALCAASAAEADDLRRNYVWTKSDRSSDLPKLGLQARRPGQRSMSFERIYMSCLKTGGLEIEVWPAAKGGDSSPPILIVEGIQYPLGAWKTSMNEMEEVLMGTTSSPDLSAVRAMREARDIVFKAPDLTMKLPAASPAVRGFVGECERWNRR